MDELSLLYLHIPFCDSKCHYCAFNSYTGGHHLKERYMRATAWQLRYDLARFGIPEGGIETVFIGGGTPSTVAPGLYGPLFEIFGPYLAEGAEITTEANPNSATEAWLAGMRALGVNRVSFGVQSFFDDKLRLLGRAHDAAEAKKAIERAAGAGFARISADLIYATAADSPERVREEVETALALGVEHLSAYELTIEEGTPFASRPEVRRESLEQARTVAETAEKGGLKRYEVSNFGRPCRHNLGYWRYRPYLGIGAGAVGRMGMARYYPLRDPAAYVENPCAAETESLDAKAVVEERLFLGLRSVVGVEEKMLDGAMRERAALLVGEGRLRRSGGRLYNPDFLLADEIALFILG